MSIRSKLKSALDAIGLLEPVRNFKLRLAEKKTRKAFETGGFRKLHLGCGGNLLPGWFNTDLLPNSSNVAALDVTKPFPFPSGSVEEIFSEHMIEHIDYTDAIGMLKECYRVLQPGGKIRVSTPNLAFLVELYEPKTELQKRYIEWSSETFIRWAPKPSSAFVINNFVRDWGHKFIFDDSTLREALATAGFVEIKSRPLGPLENESRMPDGFLQLETLTLEAIKPKSA
jgi:predicted SAM-dependent methyltransferase